MNLESEESLFAIHCMYYLTTSLRLFMLPGLIRKPQLHQRRWWVRDIFKKRKQQGDYDNLIQELRDDPEMFKSYCRLTVTQFDNLLSLIRCRLEKYSQREPIPPGSRLILTLRYLAAGDAMRSLSFAYRVGASTVTNIIRETCDAIWETFSPLYLKPLNEDDWLNVSKEFYEMWNLPNCVGALDGKHVNLKAPHNSGSKYFNYKKNYSIVLLAVCDANLKFTLVDIGAYGSSSDGGVLNNSIFGQRLKQGTLGLPEYSPMPGDTRLMPHYIVGDEAFPLSTSIMRPFGGRGLTEEKKIFNYRLSRARRCIENAFGLLVAKWQIYHTIIQAKPETVDDIIKATVILHNFLITQDDASGNSKSYKTPNMLDVEDKNCNVTRGEWRRYENAIGLQNHSFSGRRMGSHNAARAAYDIRDHLMAYVCRINPTPWQLEYVRRGTQPDTTSSDSDS